MNSAQSAGPAPDDRLSDVAAPADPPRTGEPASPAEGAPDGSERLVEPDAEQVVPTAIRSQRSTKDIVISLLVLLVPIALVLGFGRVFLGADQPTVVDPAPVIQQARAANAFPVSEPTGLADEWRTVRADFTRGDSGASLRIGYLSPDDGGLQLVQSNIPAEKLLPAELTESGRPQGATELGGRSWQRYTARPGELALVLLEPDRTVVVVGRVPEADLRQIALSLR
ncbi:DUF4245 domain-containing protein [Plantactinospora solaniradicis]|uniref:DUF4245 domain-containing protein n=1 Tax=Plantactinospora solaniradicis TaxID=1723736 RepID=A0ABW1K1Y0_9ACTN